MLFIIFNEDKFPIVIGIIDKKFRPYSSYLTMFIEDDNIVKTSIWIELIFGELASKHLKTKYKIVRRLSRFNLKF